MATVLVSMRLVAQDTGLVPKLRKDTDATDIAAMERIVSEFCFLMPQQRADTKSWLEQKATNGDVNAMYSLAIISLMDDSGKGNSIAIQWLQKAAEHGHVGAMTKLGKRYAMGDGVQQDYAEAFTLWQLAANKGDTLAMCELGDCYSDGIGATRDPKTAFKWYTEAAAKRNPNGMLRLAKSYLYGIGTSPDRDKAAKWFHEALSDTNMTLLLEADWFREAANNGSHEGMFRVGQCYYSGSFGLPKNTSEAVGWFLKAAKAGNTNAIPLLGVFHQEGEGVPQSDTVAYAWYSLAAANGNMLAKAQRDHMRRKMTPEMVDAGQKLATKLLRDIENGSAVSADRSGPYQTGALCLGTGFFVTTNGYFLTAAHVLSKARQVSILVRDSKMPATVFQVDTKTDIALLKVTGTYSALPVLASSSTSIGDDVFTVGFPNVDLQGVSPKLTKGVISGLNGIQDDPTCFQISVAIQPGNSGGPLIDSSGNVIGLITSRLSDIVVTERTGSLPQNVNYAVKSSYILPLLESIRAEIIPPEAHATFTYKEAVDRAAKSTFIVIATN